jgi:hypothetical protein
MSRTTNVKERMDAMPDVPEMPETPETETPESDTQTEPETQHQTDPNLDENGLPADIRVVAKLSVKTGANPKKVATAPGGRLHLCDMLGRVKTLVTKEDTSATGLSTALVGKFDAYYPLTNTRYQSARCYLPGGIQEVIEALVKSIPEGDRLASVDFAFRIFAVEATNAVGYTYEALPLINLSSNDGLDDIRKLVGKRYARERQAAERLSIGQAAT